MIENNTSKDDGVEYLGDRARIYYEMEQYESILVYLKCASHIKSTFFRCYKWYQRYWRL